MSKITNTQAKYYGYSFFLIFLFSGEYITFTYADTWIVRPVDLIITVHCCIGLCVCFLGVIVAFDEE